MAKGQKKQKQETINKEQFEELCALQCTEEEIASVLNVHYNTLNNWCKNTYNMTFKDVFDIKRKKGFISLRRAQFEMAKKNPTIAIWLGKQYLGQTDKQQLEVLEPPVIVEDY